MIEVAKNLGDDLGLGLHHPDTEPDMRVEVASSTATAAGIAQGVVADDIEAFMEIDDAQLAVVSL